MHISTDGMPWHDYLNLDLQECPPYLPDTINPQLLSPPLKRRRISRDMSHDAPGASSSAATDADTSQADGETAEDWSSITDPSERRRVQNRLAQRKFRAKNKEQKEERERDLQNQERAASSYSTPEPSEIEAGSDLSGLPWGGPSIQHVLSAGKDKEKTATSQAGTSSMQIGSPASQTSGGAAGGTGSRVGLQLARRFARGGSQSPSLRYRAMRFSPYHRQASVLTAPWLPPPGFPPEPTTRTPLASTPAPHVDLYPPIPPPTTTTTTTTTT